MLDLNPILVKELRSRMRGARAFVLLSVYLLVLGGVTLLLYVAMADNAANDIDAGRQIGKAMFLVIGAVALVEVCLITPTLTSGAIAGERERETYDLLIASLLSPWQIVWGKLASALAFALLLVAVVVPVMSLAFLFGGVSLAEVLIALAGLIATSVAYATLGLFWSAVLRGSLGATAFAIGSVLLLLLGVPFLAVMFTLIFGQDSSSGLFESAAFLYLSRMFLSTHPFIALGMTEASIESGNSAWIEIVPVAGASVPVPSAWLLYVLFSVLMSAVLLLVVVRTIGPLQPAVAPAPPSGSASEPSAPQISESSPAQETSPDS
jgi:ABC-type transport system involved in multi-copper enzyme maturation permease subunit